MFSCPEGCFFQILFLFPFFSKFPNQSIMAIMDPYMEVILLSIRIINLNDD